MPSSLGIALIHGYKEIDAELVVPELRSSIEKSVELIARGNAEFSEVLNNILDLFRHKYKFFVDNALKLDAFFNKSF